MTNDFFNHYIFVRTFQWTSSECLTNVTITVKVIVNISYIKEESVEHVLSKLNGYHDNIEFTYEIKNDGKLPFLDVLVIRKDHEVETIVCGQSTKNDIYLHWQSFSPTTWKQGTLQILVSRAFKVCSNNRHLQNEVKHLKKAFRDINGYPNWII